MIESNRNFSGPNVNLVSILICSKARHEALESLVADLLEMETHYPFEIVVVEETHTPIPIAGTVYVSHPVANRGIPFARNLALANATGDMLVFLDDDCLIHGQWLDKLLEPFKEASVVGVQGGVSVPEATNAVGWAETLLGFPGGGLRRVIEAKGNNRETREISTLNCAYKRRVIDKVGGFEKRLKFGGEDYTLAKQVCIWGKCLFVPQALVRHAARGSLRKIWPWFIRRGRAEIDVLRTTSQKAMTPWTLLRGSIAVKAFGIILLGILFSSWLVSFLVICIFSYSGLQYARHFDVWKQSSAPFGAFLIIPLVKCWMDVAVDWGRIRGLLFD